MNFSECIKTEDKILMEGALGERLKREYGITFDEHVAMASLVYDANGRKALTELWKEYMEIAEKYQLPFLATTPTRRANKERVNASEYTEKIIANNVKFLRNMQENASEKMYIGGLMGCKGDAYTGEGALAEDEAFAFHKWAAEQFANAKIDFLYAGIMPALPEAAGMARAMASTGIPYIISFTIQEDGRLIDGTTITEAIQYIDSVTTDFAPVCYMTNCVHPSIVYKALSQPFNQNEIIRKRFWGIQANTSPLSYAELDNAVDLKCSEPEAFAKEMGKLCSVNPFKIFGGCCGTDNRHMECVAKEICSHLEIRVAVEMDYENIRNLYYDITDALENAKYSPGWERDIYPTQEFLIDSIKKQELYLGEIDGKIVTSMVVNHEYNEGYKEVKWSVDAMDSELLVIHALGVLPDYSGRGIAKQMVLAVIKMARQNHMKTVRLDVLEGNLPAEKAYTKIGFQYLDTIQMFYEDTGWTNYMAYEYII